MKNRIIPFWKKMFQGFAADDCPSIAGALAYYAIISLPPLLVVIASLAGYFLGEERVSSHMEDQLRAMMGPTAGNQIQEMLRNPAVQTDRGWLPTLIGSIALIFGATGLFAHLQSALNKVWEVKSEDARGGIKGLVMKRLLSFGMVLVIALLLLISLVLSAALAALSGVVRGWLPEGAFTLLLSMLDLTVSIGVMTLLFAAIYKVMPDADLRWRDVWIGALFTATLFAIGKFAIGFYLGRSDVGNAYGAAGSLMTVLVWIYYSFLILMLGAEFTWVWSGRADQEPDHNSTIGCPSMATSTHSQLTSPSTSGLIWGAALAGLFWVVSRRRRPALPLSPAGSPASQSLRRSG